MNPGSSSTRTTSGARSCGSRTRSSRRTRTGGSPSSASTAAARTSPRACTGSSPICWRPSCPPATSTSPSTGTTSPRARRPSCTRATCRSGSRTTPSCWSTTCSTPAGRSARGSTRCSTTAAPRASSSPCWPTAGTASSPSGPTTSARTCRRTASERVNVRVAELDGIDEVTITSRVEHGRGPRPHGVGGGGGMMRHLLSIEDLDRARHRAHPGPREVVHRGQRARGQEGARAARPARAEPLLRGLHAHALVLRARRQDAQRRGHQLRLQRLERREGRVAQGHGADAQRLRPGPHRRPHAVRRSRGAGRALEPRRGRQRRRRQARAPDPGAARRLHPARAARLARRRLDLDRRRRPALARRALEHPGLHDAGRARDRLRPADPDPARDGGARVRGRLHARPPPGGRRRLRAAHAEGAHDGVLRALAAGVRRALPDRRPPARRPPGARCTRAR